MGIKVAKFGGSSVADGIQLTKTKQIIEQDYKDVFRQMDLYLQTPHVAEVSLCPDSAGYHFWRDQFVKACSDFIAEDKA